MALQDYRRDSWDCVRCSHCKYIHPYRVRSLRFSRICPSSIHYSFDGYSAQGRLDIARGLIDREIGPEGLDELRDVIYACTLCGGCDVMCKYYNDIDPLLVMEELRAACAKAGHMPGRLKEVLNSMEENGNPLFQPREKRGAWSQGLHLKDVEESPAEMLYYPGCNYAYDPELQGIPRLTARILERAGVDFGILSRREICCGSLALQSGDRDLFMKVAQAQVKLFARLGFKKLITSCPICYSTFKVDYRRYGIDAPCEVFHSTEFVAELFAQGILKSSRRVSLRATYHDPCHLGRLGEPYHAWAGKRVKYGRYVPPSKVLRQGTCGVYEAPRAVLQSIKGLKLVEMERAKEYSFCCGAGGGAREAYPDFSLATARERIEEALSTGAEALVTSCPWCEAQFQGALGRSTRKIQVFSLLDLVERTI